MKIRILGEKIIESDKPYRGLYREEPQYVEDEQILPYWNWYATEAGDGGYVRNVEKAAQLIEAYEKIGLDYEMVFVENEKINTKKGYLGIDICTKGGYSLLTNGLEGNISNTTDIDGIFELISRYFVPKLNKYCLFQTKNDASLFLKIVNEIQIMKPGLLEEDNFYMFYLYF